ncbi:hypothetical protein MOOTH_26760 [Moorella thermoacetica]|uniref:Uncharacterized protein n=1 Tax=Neomoorella thermoacetica TaxID=1525 RepID=A0A1J5JLX1_NEOTH|nr:hypothetical protein MOOR_26770 [Moorella thermoacetica]OIQ10434.1 hypothetical protein MOOTH_26760 [Moorella thermoacetica]
MAPQAVTLLVKAHPVAPQGGHPGRLHTGHSTADDHDLFGFWRPADGVLLFPAAGRVHRTGKGPAQEAPAQAAVVAADTGPDILAPPGHDLVNPVRIREKAAADGDHIGLALDQGLLCQPRYLQPASHDHRYLHHFL